MVREKNYKMSSTHTLAGHIISSGPLEVLDSVFCPGRYLKCP